MKSFEHQCLDFWRSKPADEEYKFCAIRACAVYQFLSDAGYPVSAAAGTYWLDLAGVEHPLAEPVRYAARGYPYTFGAAADRLEKLLAEQSNV